MQGIISLHNDSVRKYAHDEYMHGRKHRQAKATVPKRGRTPSEARKRNAKPGARKRRNRTDDSDSEDSAPAPDARKRVGKHRGGGTGRARGEGSGRRARGNSRGKTSVSDDGDGTGRRPVLPAGRRTAAVKYLSILASNMSDASKTDVIETMLVAETDRSLQSLITDHLEEQLSLEQLACILQDNDEED